MTTLRVSVFSDDLEPFELLEVYGGRGEGWGDAGLKDREKKHRHLRTSTMEVLILSGRLKATLLSG